MIRNLCKRTQVLTRTLLFLSYLLGIRALTVPNEFIKRLISDETVAKCIRNFVSARKSPKIWGL